jgi:hypothetical protein
MKKIVTWLKAQAAKLSVLVASTGQNIQFVAFFAHLGVGACITRFAIKHGVKTWILFAIFIVGGAIKEYYFDARDEVNPPQTFWDNTQDFIGWCCGPVVGAFLL